MIDLACDFIQFPCFDFLFELGPYILVTVVKVDCVPFELKDGLFAFPCVDEDDWPEGHEDTEEDRRWVVDQVGDLWVKVGEVGGFRLI